MKLQDSVRWDKPRNGLIAIRQMRCDAKTPLAPDAHTLDSVFQTGNDPPLSNAKRILLVLLKQPATIEK